MRRLSTFLVLVFVVSALSGCGILPGGDDDDGDGTPLPPPTTVEESLDRLGVDRTETPRVDPQGTDLPADYSPLGSRFALRKYSEVAFLGVEREASPTDSLVYLKNTTDVGNNVVTTNLHTKNQTELPWASISGATPAHMRWATTGDIDGDGAEELLVAYRESGDVFVRIRIIGHEADTFATGDAIIVDDAGTTIEDLKVISADFNGDGFDDVAVAAARESSVDVVYMVSNGTTLTQSGAEFSLTPVLTNSVVNLKMAVANLDYDNGYELGIVMNELGVGTAAATFSVRDDLPRDAVEVVGGAVQTTVATVVRQARVADIAFGDIDGDHRPEIVLGGITNPTRLDNGTTTFGHVVYALRDMTGAFAAVSGTYFDYNFNGASESGQGVDIDTAFVNTVDLLGDGRKRVQLNQFILDPTTAWSEIYQINDGDLIYEGGDGQRRFEHNTASMVVADVTQDGREDIVFYSQDQDDVRVWGVDMIDGWGQLTFYDTAFSNGQTPIWPVIIPSDVDDDGIAVQYSGGQYQLVFTEPVIIAALAGAPCSEDWGQSLDSCVTTFGEAESATVSLEDTYTVTAGVTVGFSQEFSILGVSVGGFELLANVETSASRSQGSSYTLTKGIVHTTGPTEDSVLFTSIPMDQWTYTILSHPNPELIGGDIVISLPREPIQAMVTRELFNASVLEESVKVGTDVFAHTQGDPRTYPSRTEKDAILAQFEGLETSEVDVGQGGGSVGVELSVYNEVSQGSSYGLDFSMDVQATAGVLVLGFSVGYGTEHSVSIANGQESSYTGTVGNLDAENFGANPYSFGLFTYITERDGQQFETLNYWTHFQTLPQQ